MISKEEWEALRARGKLVELRPPEFQRMMRDDVSYHDLWDTLEQQPIGLRAKWLRDKIARVFRENLERLRREG